MASGTLITPNQFGQDVEELSEIFPQVKLTWQRSVRSRNGEQFDFWSVSGPIGPVTSFEEDIEGARLFLD